MKFSESNLTNAAIDQNTAIPLFQGSKTGEFVHATKSFRLDLFTSKIMPNATVIMTCQHTVF